MWASSLHEEDAAARSVAPLYLQGDASVDFGQWGHAVLPVSGVTAQSDQVVVAVAVGDQRGHAVGLEVQCDGLGLERSAVLLVDDDWSHLEKKKTGKNKQINLPDIYWRQPSYGIYRSLTAKKPHRDKDFDLLLIL